MRKNGVFRGPARGWGSGATWNLTGQHKSVCGCMFTCTQHAHMLCACPCAPTRRLRRSLLLHEGGLRQLLDGQLLQQLLRVTSELRLGLLGGGPKETRERPSPLTLPRVVEEDRITTQTLPLSRYNTFTTLKHTPVRVMKDLRVKWIFWI